MRTKSTSPFFFAPAKTVATVAIIAAAVALIGCGSSSGGGSFSILGTAQGYHQADAKINNKIDILWVVDNSGSMDPLQQNLTSNFASFMTSFQGKGFDYQMAVTTTDAYTAAVNYRNDSSMAQFKNGHGGMPSGYRVITPATPNAINAFVANASQGSTGAGDERVFQSTLEALNSSLNSGFLRQGAFLAVVILSDEDDFSNYSRTEGGGSDHDYNQAGLLAVDSVIASLDALTMSTATDRHYNVSAITVKDEACRAQHAHDAPTTIVGSRYIALANKTNGILGSVCDSSFATSLNFIQQRIVELSTTFTLDRVPNPATISVAVNGVVIANDAANGWTYSADSNSISFHGTSVPPASANVGIAFDPATFK